jgi:hypothetical protein
MVKHEFTLILDESLQLTENVADGQFAGDENDFVLLARLCGPWWALAGGTDLPVGHAPEMRTTSSFLSCHFSLPCPAIPTQGGPGVAATVERPLA